MHCYECDVCPSCEMGRCDLCAECSCGEVHKSKRSSSEVIPEEPLSLDIARDIKMQMDLIRSSRCHQIMSPIDICHLDDADLIKVLVKLREIHDIVDYD